VLVAVDIVPSVVARAHAVMDARICGDGFHLPFRDASVDGIWNVGVMEHFTHDRIDDMLREFRRVLRPGGSLLLLWPGTTSPPQRILRVLEKVIHLRGKEPTFRFHPPEISQLHSKGEGRDVLRRNGFDELAIDGGLRSLFAFKTLVARRP
jgi:SAM-dependent methyltransferase